MKKYLALALVAITLFEAGCSTVQTKEIKKSVSDTDQVIQKSKIDQVNTTAKSIWIPHKEVVLQLPEKSKKEIALEQQVYTLRGYFDEINNLSSQIAAITDIPVIVEQGITNQSQLAGASITAKNVQTSSASSQQHRVGTKLLFSYHGTLAGLLNLAASKFNVYWEWIGDGEKIRFFKVKTQTWRLDALQGDTNFKSNVTNTSTSSSNSSGSSSSGGSSSSQIETGYSFSGDSVWTGVQKTISTMLSPNGKVAVTPATGTVTVTDTPDSLRAVNEYIQTINHSMLKQVAISVRVLSVDISNNNNYGLNWNAVYKSLSNNVSAGLTSGIAPIAGATNLSMSVIGNGQFSGSNALVSALSKQGNVSQVTSNTVTTLNNQAVPVQVAEKDVYLASSQTTLNNGQSSTALQPGTVTTGFVMNLLPHVLDDDRVLLQFGVDISRLISISSITSGNSSIQTPKTGTQNFLQRVRLRSGDTLVVSGFEQANKSSDQQGVGDASNLLLGGSTNSTKKRNALVILIQPVILGD